MPTGAKPKTVLETILAWSTARPAWQRDALRRIVQNGHLDDSDIKDLVALCKARWSTPTVPATPKPLDRSHLPADPRSAAAVSLLSIEDVLGANLLAPSQTLQFAPTGLTVIYGDNGTGKSGYARILKRACRARHSGPIQGNIYAAQPTGLAQATLTYSVSGVPQTSETWQDREKPHPKLSAISVFDSNCAAVHLEGKNDVAFRPFGLDVPDALAGACQRVKEALLQEQQTLERERHPLFSKPSWNANTKVGKFIATLSHSTDARTIAVFATLTLTDRDRLARLREDLAKDPAKAAAEQKLHADAIKLLLDALANIETQFSDANITQVAALAYAAAGKREAARLAAERAFAAEHLSDIGGTAWRALWDAARRYSTEVAYPGQPFPAVAEGSVCVLCHQAISPDAASRMTRFERFIQHDIERQAKDAEKLASDAVQRIAAYHIGTKNILPSIQQLALHSPNTAQEVRRLIASARLRRRAFLKSLTVPHQSSLAIPSLAPSPQAALCKLEVTTRQYAANLQSAANSEQRKKLQTEFTELADQATLNDIQQTVLDEITRLKALHAIEQALQDTTTHAITKLGNDIADTVITPQLRDRFQEEIVTLAGHRVRVEIVRSGGKFGSPQYQVRLFAKPDAKIASVLSEGEKTCVALAAFLTELATSTHRSALIFDDPVSSLDHRWRKQVAARLVSEAADRQVIVFTHDLVFVNDLLDLASANTQTPKLITLTREQSGAGVVSDGLPWKIKSVEDRIDKLEKDTRTAKEAYDSHDEELYRQQASSIYNHLRATWERALEDIAFSRVIQRHRDYIETKNLKKATVLTDADANAFHIGFKKCCDVIDAHDPSAGRNAEPPPPLEIQTDIQALKTWVTSIRSRQAAIR